MKKSILITLLITTLTHHAFSKIEPTDYIQILCYGQSLSQGWECPRAITTEPLEGNFMLGDSPLMNYNSGEAILTPLTATVFQSGGEQPIVACVNVFSQRYRQNVNSNQLFIGMTGGQGGQTIEQLSKECTNPGYYHSTFTKILNNTIATLPESKSVSCPAIIYMQGEQNCDNQQWYGGVGLAPGYDATNNKHEYKKLLTRLKNNMQSDIMQIYGQSQKPLFFIYQTSGRYVQARESHIAMAQYEFARENDDVVLLNPHYAMPDYNGGHLSPNGYRWFGEKAGNILYDVLIEEKEYSPVYPQNISAGTNEITIEYHVPAPPLRFDTWTTPQAGNYGFVTYKDDKVLAPDDIRIVDGNKIVLSYSEALQGKIEIVYAGNPTTGTGNVCDSYSSTSYYTYFDDSQDTKNETYTPTDEQGTEIYGQHYPMQNWSVSFYHRMDIKEPGTEIEFVITHNEPGKLGDEITATIGENNPLNTQFLSIAGEAGLTYDDCRAIVETFPGLTGLDLSRATFLNNEIATGAFENLSASDIRLPDNIEKINTSAFKDCKRLTALTLYAASVSKNAFDGVDNLKSVYYTADALPEGTHTGAFDGMKIYVPSRKRSAYTSLTNAVICDGTPQNEYKIISASDLDVVRLYQNNEATYILENSIDLNDWINHNACADVRQNGWLPIGNESHPFAGQFAGNGHFITGLHINRPAEENTGLFGVVSRAEIRNTGIKVQDGKSVSGQKNVGIIAGHITGESTIEQCYASGSVLSSTDNAGSIAGLNTSANLVIRQCYSDGNVTGTHSCGGILGAFFGQNANTNIEECYSLTLVRASTTGGSGGGLVGSMAYDNSTIPDSPVLLIRNSAAINQTINAKRGGRLLGEEKDARYVAYENNYAYRSMMINRSTITTGKATNKDGQNKTPQELTSKSTYHTWDFEGVWKMNNDKYPLPILKNMDIVLQPTVNPSYLPEAAPSSLRAFTDEVLLAYPNPVHDMLYIKGKTEEPAQLYDWSGQLLIQTNREDLDISHLPSGVYFLQNGDNLIKVIKSN